MTPLVPLVPPEFQSTLPHGERRRQTTRSIAAGVSIHAPARGATQGAEARIGLHRFQSTLPHGERPLGAKRIAADPVVSIHAPARGATQRGIIRRVHPGVSIHAPARGATLRPWPTPSARKFQSTLPHGERPPSGANFPAPAAVSIHAPARGATRHHRHGGRPSGVSIHAPARGATRLRLARRRGCSVSIHAPARGATRGPCHCDVSPVFQSTLPHGERPPCRRMCRALRRFNPRSRTGSDVRVNPLRHRHPSFNPRSRTGSDGRHWSAYQRRGLVSIHAPARGATQAPIRRPMQAARFNPRSRTGSDKYARHQSATGLEFQSTLPHGERRGDLLAAHAQPTVSIHAPARGATGDLLAAHAQPTVSIHAPARGATSPSCSPPPVSPLFQSTLPHGERPVYRYIVAMNRVSIHAPARGATRCGHAHCRDGCFNPRSRTGSDAHCAICADGVSIHAPARGATFGTSGNLQWCQRFQSTLPHGERPTGRRM